MLRDNLELNSGLIKFHSKDSVSAYLETLLQYYKTRQEEYGHQLGEQLRSAQETPKERKKAEKEAKKEKGGKQPVAKGWSRVGPLLVNTGDAGAAIAEVTLRIVDDYKARVERVSDALKAFNDVDTLSQAGTRSYTLLVFRGVPEAVIIGEDAKKVEAFAFSGSFKAV